MKRLILLVLLLTSCGKETEEKIKVYRLTYSPSMEVAGASFVASEYAAGFGIPPGSIFLVDKEEAAGCHDGHDLWIYYGLWSTLRMRQQEQLLWREAMHCFHGRPIEARDECGGAATYMHPNIQDEDWLEANHEWLRDELFYLPYTNPNCGS